MSSGPLQVLLLTAYPTSTILEASLRKSQDLEVIGVFDTCLAAMAFIHMRLPDLFIFDIELYGSDCINLANTLEQYKVPFLLYSTASNDLAGLDKAFHKAAWFGKPSRTDELVAIIKAAAAFGRLARNFIVPNPA
jgi:DNA-binding NarL/FixJ family response regulator